MKRGRNGLTVHLYRLGSTGYRAALQKGPEHKVSELGVSKESQPYTGLTIATVQPASQEKLLLPSSL